MPAAAAACSSRSNCSELINACLTSGALRSTASAISSSVSCTPSGATQTPQHEPHQHHQEAAEQHRAEDPLEAQQPVGQEARQREGHQQQRERADRLDPDAAARGTPQLLASSACPGVAATKNAASRRLRGHSRLKRLRSSHSMDSTNSTNRMVGQPSQIACGVRKVSVAERDGMRSSACSRACGVSNSSPPTAPAIAASSARSTGPCRSIWAADHLEGDLDVLADLVGRRAPGSCRAASAAAAACRCRAAPPRAPAAGSRRLAFAFDDHRERVGDHRLQRLVLGLGGELDGVAEVDLLVARHQPQPRCCRPAARPSNR
jgi:hypothetical protein